MLPDPRFADLILPFSEKNLEKANVVLIGVPTDEGIIRNGGRPGAAQAPDEIRRCLGKLTPFSLSGSAIIFFDDLYGKHISKEFESFLSDDTANYVSIDIDSIRSSDAPGSSAPSPIGLRAEDAIHICYHAGLNPNTKMLDIVEVNPL